MTMLNMRQLAGQIQRLLQCYKSTHLLAQVKVWQQAFCCLRLDLAVAAQQEWGSRGRQTHTHTRQGSTRSAGHVLPSSVARRCTLQETYQHSTDKHSQLQLLLVPRLLLLTYAGAHPHLLL
jgi:hypothetical protein